MDKSEIVVSPSATTFAGPDAVNLYRAAVLEGSLRLYAKCGMIPSRGVTIGRMLALASTYTGKHYKRGSAAAAADDVRVWCDNMKAALPITHK